MGGPSGMVIVVGVRIRPQFAAIIILEKAQKIYNEQNKTTHIGLM